MPKDPKLRSKAERVKRNPTGAGTVCGGCIEEIERILALCSGTSVKQVIEAVEEVGRVTSDGVEEGCGRCKPLIQNIIDTGK